MTGRDDLSPPRCFALIPAAGIGTRTGAAIPKQYLPIAGAPMIVHTLNAFAAVDAIERIVVVVAPDDGRCDEWPLDPRVAARVDLLRVGGATRAASVANGLVAIGALVAAHDWILVHDAARCGITPGAIASLISALGDDAVGGLLALPIDDTVKRQDDDPADDGRGDRTPVVAATVDRRGLWRAQTPQMFRYRLLADALAAATERGLAVTDEASAVEAAGHRVRLVPGDPRNFKVTSADDLAMMASLLSAPPATDRRDRSN